MRQDQVDGSLWIQRDPRPDAASADRREGTRHIGGGFDVDGEIRRARVGVAVDPIFRALDHQVDVEGKASRLSEVPHHLWAKREIRDEVTVHHVDVDPVRSGSLDGKYRVGKPGEVRREDGRSELWFSQV